VFVRWVNLLGMIALCCGITMPALSADKISFTWGLLEFPIAVTSLEDFAETGVITTDLKLFLNSFSQKQREQLRQFLRSRYRVDPIVVSRLSHTAVGTELLTSLGEIIQTPTGQNGFYALRSAVILATMQPEGTTPLSLLQQLPLDMEVDLGKLLQLQKQIATIDKETKQLIADNLQLLEAEAALEAIIETQPTGNFTITQQTLTLSDRRPDWLHDTSKTLARTLNLDLYLPQTASTSLPIIVVSNGLGARRDRFDYLGKYLASHGFAVIIPDHPGSDRQRQEDFYRGLYPENFAATEFIDRPLDISFILDTLQQEPALGLHDRLDFDNVGIFGYSFGGATALTLAGAEIDWKRLATECQTTQKLLNISLFYQCRALELPRLSLQLQDKRVQGLYLFVPFSSILFSRESMSRLKLPILWNASDQDLITPLVLEQLPAFEQLETPNKYVVIFQKLPHTFVTSPENDAVSIAQLRQITKKYHNILSLAFFGKYLQQNPSYLPYLTPQGIQNWSIEGYKPILLN
jgi:predicted dienelactone hydrolase